MKKVIVALGFSLAIASASGPKPCEELKSDIVAKLEAKGVKNYQLEIVANADVKGQTVVGSCEAGTKKITYKKGEPAGREGKPPAAPQAR